MIKSYGLVDATLTSKNAVIPVVYYLYHRNIDSGFESRGEYADDRIIIKRAASGFSVGTPKMLWS